MGWPEHAKIKQGPAGPQGCAWSIEVASVHSEHSLMVGAACQFCCKELSMKAAHVDQAEGGLIKEASIIGRVLSLSAGNGPHVYERSGIAALSIWTRDCYFQHRLSMCFAEPRKDEHMWRSEHVHSRE